MVSKTGYYVGRIGFLILNNRGITDTGKAGFFFCALELMEKIIIIMLDA